MILNLNKKQELKLWNAATHVLTSSHIYVYFTDERMWFWREIHDRSSPSVCIALPLVVLASYK